MSDARPPRLALWLAVLAGVCAVVYLLVRPGARAPRPAPVVTLPEAPRDVGPAPQASAPAAHTVGSSGLLPGDRPTDDGEQRYLARMAQTKQALLDKTRYPLDSRPLATKTDLVKPHNVEATRRGLSADPKDSHGVLVTQNQDRVWVSPGQPAVASIQAMQGGAPVALTVQRSDLVTQSEDGQGNVTPGSVVGNPTFRDDGVAPDEVAGDGTWTAAVVLPSDGATGSVVLSVDAAAGGEQGTLIFNFIATASPPAVFTQSARDALEDGSIAVYVGVQVQRPGTYEVVGRLYDSTGVPLVYMRFLGDLDTSSTEVRLPAFGKVILDEGGVPPYVLRDVEGARMVFGQYPDREPMLDWAAGYTTADYPLSDLSSADYSGADKARKVAALDQAAKDGLADIRAHAAARAAATPAAAPAPAPGGGSH